MRKQFINPVKSQMLQTTLSYQERCSLWLGSPVNQPAVYRINQRGLINLKGHAGGKLISLFGLSSFQRRQFIYMRKKCHGKFLHITASSWYCGGYWWFTALEYRHMSLLGMLIDCPFRTWTSTFGEWYRDAEKPCMGFCLCLCVRPASELRHTVDQ